MKQVRKIISSVFLIIFGYYVFLETGPVTTFVLAIVVYQLYDQFCALSLFGDCVEDLIYIVKKGFGANK